MIVTHSLPFKHLNSHAQSIEFDHPKKERALTNKYYEFSYRLPTNQSTSIDRI